MAAQDDVDQLGNDLHHVEIAIWFVLDVVYLMASLKIYRQFSKYIVEWNLA